MGGWSPQPQGKLTAPMRLLVVAVGRMREGPERELTERYTAALERAIRRAPEQYFWVHRRWKSQPRQRKAKQRAA